MFESISCSFNLLLTFYDYCSFFVLVAFFIEGQHFLLRIVDYDCFFGVLHQVGLFNTCKTLAYTSDFLFSLFCCNWLVIVCDINPKALSFFNVVDGFIRLFDKSGSSVGSVYVLLIYHFSSIH